LRRQDYAKGFLVIVIWWVVGELLDQMRALVEMLFARAAPSTETFVYGLIGFGILAVSLFIVGQSVVSWWKARHPKKEPVEDVSEPTPKLTVVQTELKEDEKNLEIELVLDDGHVIRHEARFYYINIKNTGKRSVEIEATWLNQHMIFVPLNRKPFFRVESKRDTESFKQLVTDLHGEAPAIGVTLLNDERWVERDRITIHPGRTGETFVLFFTLKDFELITIPGLTRLYPNHGKGIPCAIMLPIHLVGREVPEYVLRFNVTVNSWHDFAVEQIGQIVEESSGS
jgi:hypothetical protein